MNACHGDDPICLLELLESQILSSIEPFNSNVLTDLLSEIVFVDFGIEIDQFERGESVFPGKVPDHFDIHVNATVGPRITGRPDHHRDALFSCGDEHQLQVVFLPFVRTHAGVASQRARPNIVAPGVTTVVIGSGFRSDPETLLFGRSKSHMSIRAEYA